MKTGADWFLFLLDKVFFLASVHILLLLYGVSNYLAVL